jgi:serine/threonine protein kinase
MVDLWALGVTIFKLMTGYTPFESEYHINTIENINKGQFFFPSALKFECSQAPKSLIKRLLKRSRK